MFLVHLFVCLARVWFCPFSLPLGVEGWLRFVIVAYPGPFYINVSPVYFMDARACQLT